MSYLSQTFYISDGAQRDFAVPFPVIKTEYIKVYQQIPNVHGVFSKELESLGFIVIDATMIRLGAPAPAGNRVVVRRETFASYPLVDWQDAAILVETDLDLATLQALHVAQEAKDQNASSIAQAMSFFEKLQEDLQAVIAEGLAVQDKIEAFVNEVNQLVVQTENLLAIAQDAKDVAVAASQQAVEASIDAKASEYWAKLWASQSPGVEVADGFYSARHYADRAQANGGDMADHVAAEDPHPQYLRKDQAGEGFFEIDSNGDVQMREVITAPPGQWFYSDAWGDVAIF